MYIRDYFPEAGDRFTIIALLQLMSTFGELVAPVFGGQKNTVTDRHGERWPMVFLRFFCSMFFSNG
jgi:MFS family permease